MSAGCHMLIHELSAVCVTSATDVIAEIPPQPRSPGHAGEMGQ
jgi:hypothetical protein